jgi:hypothetical protein
MEECRESVESEEKSTATVGGRKSHGCIDIAFGLKYVRMGLRRGVASELASAKISLSVRDTVCDNVYSPTCGAALHTVMRIQSLYVTC